MAAVSTQSQTHAEHKECTSMDVIMSSHCVEHMAQVDDPEDGVHCNDLRDQ